MKCFDKKKLNDKSKLKSSSSEFPVNVESSNQTDCIPGKALLSMVQFCYQTGMELCVCLPLFLGAAHDFIQKRDSVQVC